MSKNLKDFYTDIQKCSKCGLCMSVCPVYEILKNDCAVSRGKFIMLKAVLDGKLNYDKKLEKYIDICLKCNKCKDSCPTNINSREIFLKAKEEIFKKNKNCFLAKNIFFIFKFVMNCAKFFIALYRFLKIYKLLKAFYPLLFKNKIGRKIIAINKLLEPIKIPKKSETKQNLNDSKKTRVVYFKGCIDKYINKNVKNSTEFLLNKLNVEIIPIKFKCCGTAFLYEGDIENFLKSAQYNISQIPEDFDYFLTDCTTCQNSFTDYEKYIEDEKIKEKIKKINSKSISVIDFIVQNFDSINLKKDLSFTFHKPCNSDNLKFLEEFLKKCPQAKYIKSEGFDDCCGFSGTFPFKAPSTSEKILHKKSKNLLSANTDYILTNCTFCNIGLTFGVTETSHEDKNVCNFIEFIAKNII